MLVLSCSNLRKTYVVDTILDNLSFNVEDGDKIGLIGLNGSGKTTLFNILAGELDYDRGELYVRKGIKIAYLKQHTKIQSSNSLFQECLTVFKPLIEMEKSLRELEEEIADEGNRGDTDRLRSLMEDYSHRSEEFTALNGYGYKSEIRGTLKGLGFQEEDFEKEVNILSGGQKSRLALAKLLLEKADIMLLDEPTNHLDIDAISWLEKVLKDFKGAVMVISHDRYFLDNVANRIFHIENLKLNIYNTNYSNFMVRRKRELELYKKHFEDQQKEIKRQEEIILRFKSYGGEKYHRLAQSRQKLLDKMKILSRPQEEQKSRIRFEPKIKSGRDVLALENIGKSFGDFTLLKDISFNIYRGEKVGLIGPNGIGKTSLFKIVLGQIQRDTGSVNLGHNVVPGYFDQEMSRLNLDKTIMDEIWDENPRFDHFKIRSILSQFMFIGDDIFKEISDLSGGEKARLSLLKLMLSKSNFLLMDEPTNHLDIDSKEVLEEALLDYQGTVFIISHDRYFLNKVTDKILELTKEGLVQYLGNYDYYLEKKNEPVYQEEEEGKTRTQIRLEKKREREVLKEERDKRKLIGELEKEIAKEEEKLEELDILLCQPEIYQNHQKVVELSKTRELGEKRLEALYNQWISLTG
ncbi:MAG: ABC-F family ATP-binding cassette domain-containing protein [Tissierellaceae bacterium]